MRTSQTTGSGSSILLSHMNSDTVHVLVENRIKYFQAVVSRLIRDKFKIVSLADRNHLLRWPNGLPVLRQITTVLGKRSPREQARVVLDLNLEVRHKGVKVHDSKTVLDTHYQVHWFGRVHAIHEHELVLVY